MRTVCWTRLASALPMGQQLHEERLRMALKAGHSDRFEIVDRVLQPLRGSSRADRRLPLRVVWRLPYGAAAAVGRKLYGSVDLVHRFDLRCPPSGRDEVVTVHDLPPWRFLDEGELPRWTIRSARKALLVICPSEFAADEVRTLLGVERVRVIPNGVDCSLGDAKPLSDAELGELGLEGLLVVHAGGATARKNLGALARAWPLVLSEAPDAVLALCGPPDPRRDESFGGLLRVRLLGHRSPDFVARLMRSAAAVVVPSLYEGFGLPALEAMAVGTPVVASSCGALPEVCGGAALLVDPSPDDLARGISTALAGGPRVERLRQLGLERAALFSWERAARETATAYDEVLR